MTVSWLRAQGVREIVVDSSGNAGASFAAYAARAGLRLTVVRAGRRLAGQAAPGSGAWRRSSSPCRDPGRRPASEARRALEDAGPEVAYASHLWQPAFLAGTATFAYEVFEQLGGTAPDAVVAPLGGGTLLLGAHLGFGRLRAAGMIERSRG